MKSELNKCTLMRLAPSQREPECRGHDSDGWPLPDCDDGSPFVLNAELGPGGCLVPARGAQPVVDTAGMPLLADRQGGDTYVYTVDSADTLFRFPLEPGDEESALASTVCRLPQRPLEMARCGDFLVVRLADGSLYYLTVDPSTREARPLGFIPEAPRVRARAVGCRTVEATAAAVTFAKPVADFRSGIPDDVTARLRASAQKAADELQSKVRALGLWSAPVCVRVAVRLRDGSLLSVSEPVIVGAGVSSQTSLPLFWLKAPGSSGYAGTGQATLEARAFGIEVEVSGMPSKAWSGVVRGIEVWVTPQSSVAPGFSRSSASFFVSGTDSGLRLSSPAVSAVSMEKLALGPQILAASLPAADTTATLTRDETARPGEPRLESVAVRSLRAGAMTAHDSFLHLADISRPVAPPPLPSAVGDDDGEDVVCVVTVEMRASDGSPARTLSARTVGSLASTRLLPLLWYPSARAERMRIALRTADGRMTAATFALQPAADGSDAAIYIGSSETLTGFEEVDDLGDTLTGAPSEREAGTVVTMTRGNPMVAADRTRCSDGVITALCAQPSGGGAYTRQYIYVFGDSGITALLHDSAGRHVNARSVSRAFCRDRDAIAPTPEGVFAMSAAGEVLRLRDARVEVLVRGLTEYSRLAWHRSSNRLWLMPPLYSSGKCLALEMTPGVDRRLASLVSVLPGRPLAADGSMLMGLYTGSLWRLYRFADSHAPGAPPLQARWVSPGIAPGFDGPALLTLGLTAGKGSPLTVTVAGLDPLMNQAVWSMSDTLVEAKVGATADVSRTVQIPLLLPRQLAPPGDSRLRLSVAGCWSRLASWSLTPLPAVESGLIGINRD